MPDVVFDEPEASVPKTKEEIDKDKMNEDEEFAFNLRLVLGAQRSDDDDRAQHRSGHRSNIGVAGDVEGGVGGCAEVRAA